MIKDILIRAEPYTEADINVMDGFRFRALQYRPEYDMELFYNQTNLRTLQTELPIIRDKSTPYCENKRVVHI